VHLLTVSTPNGQKTQILLEELAARYGLDFTFTLINLRANEQKSDYFLRINPNGRIPVIVDNTVSPPFPVHESSAQLVYLQKKYDKDNVFGSADEYEYNDILQWLFFWHGSGAPYMGNTGYFKRAEVQSEFAINRFRTESLRVLGVLEIRLSGKYTGEPREYLAGKGKGKFTIADIGTWPWVKNYKNYFSDEEMKELPHVVQWVQRIAKIKSVEIATSDKYTNKPAS